MFIKSLKTYKVISAHFDKIWSACMFLPLTGRWLGCLILLSYYIDLCHSSWGQRVSLFWSNKRLYIDIHCPCIAVNIKVTFRNWISNCTILFAASSFMQMNKMHIFKSIPYFVQHNCMILAFSSICENKRMIESLDKKKR